MPSAAAAQWILELVTTPERAAAITGDLLEQSPRRHPAWFLLTTLRTAASHLLREQPSAWAQILCVGFGGMVACFVLALALAHVWLRLGTDIARYPYGPNSIYVPPWSFYLLLLTQSTAIPFLVGWVTGKLSRRRELLCALSLVLFRSIPAAIWLLNVGDFPRTSSTPYPLPPHSALIGFGLETASFLAGALLYRRRSQRPLYPHIG